MKIIEYPISDFAIADLKGSLSEKRYHHCCRVLETAFQIADAWTQFSIDREELAWAALFHDCAKEFSGKKRDAYVKKHGPLPCGKELMEIGPLAHGPVGALVLKTKYGIESPEIHRAVSYHSVGHVDFTPMEWAVSLADILEPGRAWLESREQLLSLVCEDACAGIRAVTQTRRSLQIAKRKAVQPCIQAIQDEVEAGRFRVAQEQGENASV